MPILGAAKRRILIELRRRRLHGYGLAEALDLPITGIYQHLKDLEKEGLIASASDDRRKTYGLTARGIKLADLLRE